MSDRRRLAILATAGALGLGLLSGCGGSSGAAAAAPSSSSSSSSAGGTAAAMIMIQGFAYSTPASVPPGATVSVMNMDGEAHTVTADSGGTFDVAAVPGSTSTATFRAPTTPGNYPFHCTYHSNMHGVLVVR